MKKIEGILYSTGESVSVEVQDGIIREVRVTTSPVQKKEDALYLAPAFFDNQINGYIGTEFSDPQLTTEVMLKIVKALQRVGVVSFLPTVITASHTSLLRSFRNLSAALEHDEVAYSVPGFHLEGPYISPVDGYRGAHSREHVRLPDWDEFIGPEDGDFGGSGLHRASGIRLSYLYAADPRELVGVIGRIEGDRLQRLRRRLAELLTS